MALWRLSEATGFQYLPHQLAQMPISVVREFSEYLARRSREIKRSLKGGAMPAPPTWML